MTVQTINVGARVNDETAETVYSAFTKTNSNFSDLDTRVSSAESTVATLSADMTELQGLFGTDVEAATFTTKQNDLAVAAGTRILRWNGAGTTGITGIAAPSTARVVTIVNASTDYLLWLENENTASAAANRFMLPDSFPAFLMPGDTITLLYDLTTARWRVLSWPTRGMGMGLTSFTDGDLAATSLYGVRVGGTGATNSSTTVGLDGTGRAVGVVYGETGTTAAGYAYLSPRSQILAPTLGPALSVARVRFSAAPDGTDTYAGNLGFHDAPPAGTLANAAMWEYRWTGAAVAWSRTVAAGGVFSRATSTALSTTASAWSVVAVFMNAAWTRADFIASTDCTSFALDASVATGLPGITQLILPAWGIHKSAGITSRFLYVDFMGHRVKQVRA